jgi:hypothetical protein
MDKRDQKRFEVLQTRLTKLRQLLVAAKKQPDEPDEIKSLEKQIADATAELAKLKG